ncbi:MAG: transcription termination factor Rho [Planctomycetes bacterium]|nr:transcription termination factor Rho [Planctomycetota bacterium]
MNTKSGVLELHASGEARLRQFEQGLADNPGDPYIPAELVAKFSLRAAQQISVEVEERHAPNRPEGVKRVALNVLDIEGLDPQTYLARKSFNELTALDPSPRLTLEHRGCAPACRLIDLFCPIGFGTRGLIVAPPKAGKTILLQNIASGIKHNNPQVELIALLIDERPEEVTDFKRNVPAHVLASSNDESVERHTALGILAIERAKRLVEAGRDVVVLLDSLTRVGRAFNNNRRYASGGRTMSGGLDNRALEVPKQLFGAARKCEEGGSLTIIATCLVDTGSRADQVIFEEFKGTGNMEVHLDRALVDRRIFPSINIERSGTRKEELLYHPDEYSRVVLLRRALTGVPPVESMELLLGKLKKTRSNIEFLLGMGAFK